MKSRVGLCALGLLMLVGALGCGGDSSPPDEKPGDTVKPAGAPTSVTATAGDGQAAVSWTPPADNGGSAITGYTVHVFTNGVVRKSVKSSAAATTVTELINGAAYTFAVAAINSLGDGHFSAPSSPVTPHTVPGAPRDIVATPGNQQVELSWNSPVDAGMPITGYSVIVTQGETQVSSQQVTGLSATFTGLTNGKAYSFTVTATNAVVAGPVSALVIATPRTTPGAPRVTAAPVYNFSNQVRLNWTLDDDGGSPVTRYTVTVRSGATVVQTRETPAKELLVLSLPSYTRYTFTVVASNAAGDGPVSESVTATPYEFAAAPQDLSCTASVKEDPAFAECSWAPPLNDGGSPIHRYRVILSDSDFRPISYKQIATFQTTELSIRLNDLKNGRIYKVQVAAETDAGFGSNAAQEYINPYTVPSKITEITTAPRDGAVYLEWVAPFDGGRGDSLVWYISVEPGGRQLKLDGGPFTEIGGLTNGTTYTFTFIVEGATGFFSEPTSVQATPAIPPR